METLEYKNVKINVPTNWDDITLGVWETFSTVRPDTPREKVEQVARACQVDPGLLLGWPEGIFTRILNRVDFLYNDNPADPSPVCEIGGVKFMIALEEELSLGEYIDAEAAQKKGEAVLSNVLAIVCRPAGEAYNLKLTEERAAMFAAAPTSSVLGVLAFFLQYKNQLEQHTALYNKLCQIADLLPQNIMFSLRRGGGIKLSRIWPIIKYWILIASLRARLLKYSRSYNTGAIKR